MAEEIKIEFVSAGFKEILNSDGVRDAVDRAAQDIKAKADAGIQGESNGFQVKTYPGKFGGGRWISVVATTDRASMVAESEDKALTRAVK